MPLSCPPIYQPLRYRGKSVYRHGRARRWQDVRPLEIAILNLMPEKEKTESPFARLLGNSHQVSLTLMQTGTYTPTTPMPRTSRRFIKPMSN